ncbi:MAG: hypothetical protein DRN07_02365 [Thermoplasmata archaeon]|nr:MAG: hypothetical protein DRN07_02365 [Thermoplasmata archaeon]
MVKGGMKKRRKVHMVIFIVIIAAMMINTGAIPGSSYKEKANQGRLFGPFLFIEPEKTEIFETEPLNVTVSINDVFVNDFRPLFAAPHQLRVDL